MVAYLLVLLCLPRNAAALDEGEESAPEHAVFAELGGPALLYSFNYEYRPVWFLRLRAGAALLPMPGVGGDNDCLLDACGELAMTIISAQGLLLRGDHHIEVGLGTSIGLTSDDDARFLTPLVGYRYEEPDGGFLFRASFTPLVRMNDFEDVLPWGGLSFGYSF
jgi:hypothetical protein